MKKDPIKIRRTWKRNPKTQIRSNKKQSYLRRLYNFITKGSAKEVVEYFEDWEV